MLTRSISTLYKRLPSLHSGCINLNNPPQILDRAWRLSKINYTKISLYVTFCVVVLPSLKHTLAWLWWRIQDNAVYSCPCEKTGRLRSTPTESSVSPWQELNVVAYAGASGNCFLSRVCPEERSAEKLILGIRMSSEFTASLVMPATPRSRCTVMSLFPNPTTTTWTFFTNPLLRDMFFISRNTAPVLMVSLWCGNPGGGCQLT